MDVLKECGVAVEGWEALGEMIGDDEDIKECLNRLVNHNGGWFVTQGEEDAKPGQIVEIHLPSGMCVSAAVVGYATQEDAKADARFLGRRFIAVMPGWIYIKVMVD